MRAVRQGERLRHRLKAVTEPGGMVVRTLADHQVFTLRAFCQPCDRSVVLDHQALADRWGWDVLLPTKDMESRFPNRHCQVEATSGRVG